MLLFLDTTDYNAIHFVLTDGKTVHQQKHQLKYNENDKTLLLLDKFLRKHRHPLSLPPIKGEKTGVKSRIKDQKSKISSILVCTGPGSFTGTRVGLTIALALRLTLKIKVAGVKKSQIPEDLRKLASTKGSSSLKISYNRPAL